MPHGNGNGHGTGVPASVVDTFGTRYKTAAKSIVSFQAILAAAVNELEKDKAMNADNILELKASVVTMESILRDHLKVSDEKVNELRSHLQMDKVQEQGQKIAKSMTQIVIMPGGPARGPGFWGIKR